jgi:AmmeMemoRadiSam system protein A
MLEHTARRALLEAARCSLEQSVRLGTVAPFPAASYPDDTRVWRSSFVTLMIGDRLRGCCGRLEAERPLIEDVWHNAYAAGFTDPRFHPLAPAELSPLHIEISVLTPLEPLNVRSTAELLAALTPRVHGLVLASGGERVTFIPHVWEGLPDAAAFVRELRRKAGWPDSGWEPDLEAWRYEAETISAESG